MPNTRTNAPRGALVFDTLTFTLATGDAEFSTSAIETIDAIRLIKERLEPGSRMFLIKQGHHSVVCQLDLQGFDPQLRVISGRASEVEYVHRLIASNGPRLAPVVATALTG